MTKIAYIDKRFCEAHIDIIEQANTIIEDYADQGFMLTVRQLYYQFVARSLIPNTMQSYKRLASIINDGRLAGEIDWEAIEDRTRNLDDSPHWDSPASILGVCARTFALDKWTDQDYRVEVWIEKEALAGVIEPICRTLDVPFLACRGYVSQSEMWVAAQRLHDAMTNEQTPVIIHLGDHDPSGIDMTRDIRDRLDLLGGNTSGQLIVNRIALNMDQVEEYQPPPNPAKMTDSRFEGYVVEYGDESWELDALEPKMMSTLIGDTVKKYRDEDRWLAMVAKQNDMRERLGILAQDWRD